MKINFNILLCKNMQDGITRHTIKHKYRHKMMNVKHETDLATYKGHLVLFIRAISISALIVLMGKKPGQISMCKYQWANINAQISVSKKSVSIWVDNKVFDLRMSAMRKMMLVTRIRMFRKVNHLRMVWALGQEILIISQTDSVTATKHSLLRCHPLWARSPFWKQMEIERSSFVWVEVAAKRASTLLSLSPCFSSQATWDLGWKRSFEKQKVENGFQQIGKIDAPNLLLLCHFD